MWGPIGFQLKDHSMEKRWKFKIFIVSYWFLNQLEPWLAWLKSWKNCLFPIKWEIEISRTISKVLCSLKSFVNFSLKKSKKSTKRPTFFKIGLQHNDDLVISLSHSTPHPTLTLCSSRVVTIYDEKGGVFAVVYDFLIRYDV